MKERGVHLVLQFFKTRDKIRIVDPYCIYKQFNYVTRIVSNRVSFMNNSWCNTDPLEYCGREVNHRFKIST